MKLLKTTLNGIMNVLAGVSFIAMVLIVCWQVFTRYIMNNPSTWTDELVSYLFAWASLFGACLVTGERGHMSIPVVVERFSANGQKVLAILSELIAMIFSLSILFYGGVRITSLAMGQLTSSLGVPVGIFYLILPIAGILNGLYALINIVEIIRNGVPKAEDEIVLEAEREAIEAKALETGG